MHWGSPDSGDARGNAFLISTLLKRKKASSLCPTVQTGCFSRAKGIPLPLIAPLPAAAGGGSAARQLLAAVGDVSKAAGRVTAGSHMRRDPGGIAFPGLSLRPHLSYGS